MLHPSDSRSRAARHITQHPKPLPIFAKPKYFQALPNCPLLITPGLDLSKLLSLELKLTSLHKIYLHTSPNWVYIASLQYFVSKIESHVNYNYLLHFENFILKTFLRITVTKSFFPYTLLLTQESEIDIKQVNKNGFIVITMYYRRQIRTVTTIHLGEFTSKSLKLSFGFLVWEDCSISWT